MPNDSSLGDRDVEGGPSVRGGGGGAGHIGGTAVAMTEVTGRDHGESPIVVYGTTDYGSIQILICPQFK